MQWPGTFEESKVENETIPERRKTIMALLPNFEGTLQKGKRKFSLSIGSQNGISLSIEDIRQSMTKGKSQSFFSEHKFFFRGIFVWTLEKVVVVGDCGVGKTALIVRLLTKRFITEYMNYKYLKYEYASTVNGKQHRYEILDLSTYNRGLYKNDAMFDEHIKWGELFFLVYSITDRESFKAGFKLDTNFVSSSLV